MKTSQKLSVDLRIVCVALLALSVTFFMLWSPWSSSATKRTITISGDATQKSEPDEFNFTPSYSEKGSDRAAIQKRLMEKITAIVAKLKELGISEPDITLSSSTYDNFYNDGTNEVTSNSLTVVVDNKDLSQRVQDYLLTTAPEGQVTPYPTFSTEKRKTLENEVRSKAVEDAKKKAERTASELGMKLGKVVSVTDNGGSSPIALSSGVATMALEDSKTVAASTLPILVGRQEVTVTVQVVYEIK